MRDDMMLNWWSNIPNFGRERVEELPREQKLELASHQAYDLLLDMVEEVGIEYFSVDIVARLNNIYKNLEKLGVISEKAQQL